MNRNDLLAIVAGFAAGAASIIAPTYIVVTNSTERTVACIESGGEYVSVPETARMECVR